MKVALELYWTATILASLLDFVLQTIYDPALYSESFIVIIMAILKTVTILIHFFSWFFMISLGRETSARGISYILRNYLTLFISTLVYAITYIIYVVILLSNLNPLYVLWNNYLLVTFWSIERIVGCIHYSISMIYTVKVSLNPSQYL